ncbi:MULTISPECIES: cache domain-containing protein [unclassified Limnobacter]|uniref:sensor histidine kinase n=2 Tax=Limnobacter TaxID=131079 RepID=UPI0025C05BF2|nr:MULTISPECIES: cache domain-containing protein [unclassified Limnobacter]
MERRIGQRPFPPRGHFWPSHWTVKTKLVVTACIPLLVLVPIVAMLVWSAGQAAYTKILISKVRSDLVLAQQEFTDVQESKSLALKSWSESAYLRNLLNQRGGKLNNKDLQAQAERLGFAYLRLISPTGMVVNSFPPRLPYMLDPEVQKSVKFRESGSYTVLLSNKELMDISPDLASRAVQAIIPTSNASPSHKSTEDRGLVVQVLQPVFNNGNMLGYLEGGLLLNGNLGLVDEINNLIYSPNTLLEGSIGTTTIFLEDVRVATTVRRDGELRALGTRVSDVVRQSVLGRGEVWLERAFVVNDWYVAAYAPLLSPEGARIGMFYVGFLEAPYANIKTQLLILFLLAVGAAMVLGAMMVVRLTSGIFYPLRRMNYIMSLQERGDTAARVGDLRREDEFADLANHFDALLDQLDARRSELLGLNEQLDERVRQRTADLQAANQKLHQAVEQLLASEKLAALGQLTAGIAHEFNNPLAIMMGHLDLIRITLNDPESLKTVRLLDEQVHRMRNIVQKLLQFCRPDEYASYTEEINVNEIIQDSILFVRNEIDMARAQLKFDFSAQQTVQFSKTELQQVMVNLLINATHALEGQFDAQFAALNEGPTISIKTADVRLSDGQPAVQILVQNNGEAIPSDRLQLIFKMFYTSKQAGRGTGLGLPVSRMLVQRYGGDLWATSPVLPEVEPQFGACFEIVLRCKARPSADILKETGQQLLLIEKQLSEGN